MVVYKTTNLVNGKWYIGKDEKNKPKYLGSGKLIKRAIKKYGRENFRKEILAEADNIEILNNLEKYYIASTNAIDSEDSYNIAEGGNGGNLIAGFSEEERKQQGIKISNGHKNMSIEKKKLRIDRISKSSMGKKCPKSPEHRKKIAESKTGYVTSEATKVKMSESRTGYKHPLVSCIHCRSSGGLANMKRWHLDNCRGMK